MARTVGRRKPIREGTGLGEHFSEIAIFIAIGIGLLLAARWYFVVYKHSPTTALIGYIGAVKSGDVDAQYALLSEGTKKAYPSKSDYGSKWKPAEGMAGHMAGDFTVSNMVVSGDKAEADVNLAVRKGGGNSNGGTSGLLDVAAENYTDHYILRKEGNEWRVALDECYNKIKSAAAVQR
jgi:hypothetical protein